MQKTPKDIKRDILGKFRSHLNAHQHIPSRIQLSRYCRMLTDQERYNFNQAVSDLIESGLLVMVKNDMPSYRLTKKGADLIF